MLNLKTNRLDELLGTITEARKSLQDWQDKRTEALIQLDALSYDIRQIEEEKNRSSELIAALKAEIEDRAKVYASHVESITDQMQMLKVEKEEAEIRLGEAIDRLQKQLDESELQRNRQRENEAEIVSTWEKRLAEQKTDFEVRYAEQHNRHREQVESLNLEINTLLEKIEVLKSQVAEHEIRADRNDRELQVFRSQMMNLLRVSETENLSNFFKPSAAAPSAAPLPAGVAESRARFDDRPANPYIIPTNEALQLAARGFNQNGEKVATGATASHAPTGASVGPAGFALAGTAANAASFHPDAVGVESGESSEIPSATSAAVSAAVERAARNAGGKTAARSSARTASNAVQRTPSPTNASGKTAAAPATPANDGSLRSKDGFVVAGGVTAQLGADSTVEEYLKRLGY